VDALREMSQIRFFEIKEAILEFDVVAQYPKATAFQNEAP
jgi:hypothetical protein